MSGCYFTMLAKIKSSQLDGPRPKALSSLGDMTKLKASKTKGSAPVFLEVDSKTVEERGFFCYMSKKKTDGYKCKLSWLKARFAEGMRLVLLELPERGFIEYIPGEHAWRAVQAEGYMFIHCLWVVGRSKGKGFGAALVEKCVADAKRQKMRGVAMITSEKNWLAGRRVLERLGFERTAEAPPAFSLMVKKFGKHASPAFAGHWEKKARACGGGLTVFRSDQCPYISDAAAIAAGCARKAGVQCREIGLQSREDVLRLSPTPYGTYGLVLDGKLQSYHYLLEKDLRPLLSRAASTSPRD
jgi:ribosomal protein S18 acetylase RimI-like enzyme